MSTHMDNIRRMAELEAERDAALEQVIYWRERAVGAEGERAALAAHVERLKQAGEAIRHELAQWSLTERDPETGAAMCQFDHVSRETPTTSLARMRDERAQAIQQAVKQARQEWARQHLDAMGIRYVINAEGWPVVGRQAEEPAK